MQTFAQHLRAANLRSAFGIVIIFAVRSTEEGFDVDVFLDAENDNGNGPDAPMASAVLA